MIRFAADEDLHNQIIRGLRRRLPQVDLERVQDVGLRTASDAEVLAWAASAGRVLLSHDASTITTAAYARLARSELLPGVIIIPQSLSIGTAIDDLAIIARHSSAEDWCDRVMFLPLHLPPG